MPAGADPVIHVATTGHDTARCGRAADPCKTISYAFGRAANADTIQVAAGAYTLAGPLKIAKPGIRRKGAKAGVKAAARAPGRPGKPAVTTAALTQGSASALARLFSAQVSAFLKKNHGHGSLAMTLTPADLAAYSHVSSKQPHPQQACVRADHQPVCPHLAVHHEMSLHVAKAAVPTPARAGRPVTLIITIINIGSTAPSGLAGAGRVHLNLPGHRPAVQVLSRVRQGTGQYRVRPQRLQRPHQQPAGRGGLGGGSQQGQQGQQHGAHRPAAGSTGHTCAPKCTGRNCTPKCSPSTSKTRAPIVPVTG